MFWAVGSAEKKKPNCHKYDTFEVILFSWPKKLFENILASSQVTKNKGEKKFRKFWKVFYFGLEYLFWNKSVICTLKVLKKSNNSGCYSSFSSSKSTNSTIFFLSLFSFVSKYHYFWEFSLHFIKLTKGADRI